jgi:hypothetical protein
MTRHIRKSLLSVGALVGLAFAMSTLAVQPAQAEMLVIRDFVLTHGVLEREPVGSTEAFVVEDGRAYAFARINNEGNPTTVSFVWQYGNEQHAAIDMNVGTSSGWRTWSSVSLRPGNWQVQLVGSDGVVLAQRTFSVGMQSGASNKQMDQNNNSSSMKQNSSTSSPSYGGWTGKSGG